MSEEKTKIVQRSPPKPAGDSITFKCANDHRIVVSAKLAGKRGTCSKCGISVVIPSANGMAPTASEPEQPPATEQTTEIEALVAGGEAPPAAPAAEPNAFANLFNAVSADQAQDAVLDDAVGDVAQEPPERGGSGSVGDVVPHYAAEEYAGPSEVSAVAENPTAQLVARLWAERDHGGIVELHITGGSVILPEWYEPRWSRGTHGLFASEAADGTVTLTAVAWDSIQKIIVRKVEGLPDGMFG